MPDVIVKGLLREKLQYILNILKKEGFAAEQLKGVTQKDLSALGINNQEH